METFNGTGDVVAWNLIDHLDSTASLAEQRRNVKIG